MKKLKKIIFYYIFTFKGAGDFQLRGILIPPLKEKEKIEIQASF